MPRGSAKFETMSEVDLGNASVPHGSGTEVDLFRNYPKEERISDHKAEEIDPMKDLVRKGVIGSIIDAGKNAASKIGNVAGQMKDIANPQYTDPLWKKMGGVALAGGAAELQMNRANKIGSLSQKAMSIGDLGKTALVAAPISFIGSDLANRLQDRRKLIRESLEEAKATQKK